MLFRQLGYFVAVARKKRFARAAEACCLSQSALPSAIARLERELKGTLINRGRYFEGRTPEDKLASLASLAGDAEAARGEHAAAALCGFDTRCLPAGPKQALDESARHRDGEMAAVKERQRRRKAKTAL
jgi:hypothetical protein